MSKNNTGLIVAIVAVIAISAYLLYTMKHEGFAVHTGKPSNLPTGMYTIKNKNGVVLISDVFDTLMCNDFLLGRPFEPSKDSNWLLHRVAQSVYIFYKPSKKECLFTHPTDSLRSYFFPTCQGKSLCGLEQPDAYGEIDPESLRTYFMILQDPSGKYYIKSMKNDMYVCMSDKKISLVDQPTEECLFDIQPLDA